MTRYHSEASQRVIQRRIKEELYWLKHSSSDLYQMHTNEFYSRGKYGVRRYVRPRADVGPICEVSRLWRLCEWHCSCSICNPDSYRYFKSKPFQDSSRHRTKIRRRNLTKSEIASKMKYDEGMQDVCAKYKVTSVPPRLCTKARSLLSKFY